MKLAILSAVASIAIGMTTSTASAQQPEPISPLPVSPGPAIVPAPPVVVTAPPVVIARPPLVVVAPPIVPPVAIVRPGLTIGIGGYPYPYYGFYGRPYCGPYHYYRR